jgi:acyl dehydratase
VTAEPRFAHELQVGDAYEPLDFTISGDLNEQFLYAIAEHDPVYVGGEAAPAQLHPMILLHMSARTRSKSFRLAPNMGSVYARERVRFRQPAYVGERLTASWTIGAVYEKKGRLYQQLDIQVRGPRGVVLDREMHSVFFTLERPRQGATA